MVLMQILDWALVYWYRYTLSSFDYNRPVFNVRKFHYGLVWFSSGPGKNLIKSGTKNSLVWPWPYQINYYLDHTIVITMTHQWTRVLFSTNDWNIFFISSVSVSWFDMVPLHIIVSCSYHQLSFTIVRAPWHHIAVPIVLKWHCIWCWNSDESVANLNKIHYGLIIVWKQTGSVTMGVINASLIVRK